jgi:hypothetical protein
VNRALLMAGVLALLAACSNADVAHLGTWGGSQHVVLYAANGVPIHEWDSDGLVKTEHSSDAVCGRRSRV